MTRITVLTGSILAALAMQGCSFAPSKAVDIERLNPPGYFDVGVGYGVIHNASDSGQNDDAEGIVASFKGYPFGRWYSTYKVASARAEVLANVMQGALVEQVHKITNPDGTVSLLRTFRKKTLADVGKPKPISELSAGSVDMVAVQVKTLPAALLSSEGLDKARLVVFDATTVNGVKVKAREISLPEVEASADTVLSDVEVTGLDIDSVVNALADIGIPENYVVEVDGARRGWPHRLSVFYGVSVGDFNGGGITSTANTFGLGFDVTPELAVLLGTAFYRQEENGVEDTDNALFFGVSLNLNAFKALYSAAAR